MSNLHMFFLAVPPGVFGHPVPIRQVPVRVWELLRCSGVPLFLQSPGMCLTTPLSLTDDRVVFSSILLWDVPSGAIFKSFISSRHPFIFSFTN